MLLKADWTTPQLRCCADHIYWGEESQWGFRSDPFATEEVFSYIIKKKKKKQTLTGVTKDYISL